MGVLVGVLSSGTLLDLKHGNVLLPAKCVIEHDLEHECVPLCVGRRVILWNSSGPQKFLLALVCLEFNIVDILLSI